MDVVRTKCDQLSSFFAKVDVVLPSVVVVCTKFCAKKEKNWQDNFDIKTTS